jgi:hypothetical protein
LFISSYLLRPCPCMMHHTTETVLLCQVQRTVTCSPHWFKLELDALQRVVRSASQYLTQTQVGEALSTYCGPNGITLLHRCCEMLKCPDYMNVEHVHMVCKWILEQGANPNAGCKTTGGSLPPYSALSGVIAPVFESTVRIFLQAGARPVQTARIGFSNRIRTFYTWHGRWARWTRPKIAWLRAVQPGHINALSARIRLQYHVHRVRFAPFYQEFWRQFADLQEAVERSKPHVGPVEIGRELSAYHNGCTLLHLCCSMHWTKPDWVHENPTNTVQSACTWLLQQGADPCMRHANGAFEKPIWRAVRDTELLSIKPVLKLLWAAGAPVPPPACTFALNRQVPTFWQKWHSRWRRWSWTRRFWLNCIFEMHAYMMPRKAGGCLSFFEPTRTCA